ncbi:MAG: thiolase domain-containing protein [Planctomycetota bacterium]|nr:MAG: thiolase domain-containing protein [Planctomycetota bacterium]
MERKVYILGGENTTFIGKFHPDFIWKGHPDFGKRQNPSLEEHLMKAVELALKAVGVSPEMVEKGFVGNFAGELFVNQGHLGALVTQYEGLKNKPFMRVEGACASGGLAMVCGFDAIRAGYDVVLVVGGEVQTTRNARDGADYLARAAHYATQRQIDDFTFPCLFARRAKYCLEKTELTREDLAKVVVKAYENANKNPKAHMHSVKVNFEDALEESDTNPTFLSNPEYKPYLKVKDCSQVSDGASALIMASEEGLKKLGKTKEDCIELIGLGHVAAPLKEEVNPISLDTTQKAASIAYDMAKITPQEVSVAEVHDCFSITEILMYEALGFAEPQKGYTLIREGATQISGKIPVNTGGGLIAFGHPVGATGVKQIVEIFKQLKGKAGAYQIPGSPKIGLAANMGGDDRTAVVSLFRNP